MSEMMRAHFKKLLESKKQGELSLLLSDSKLRQLPASEREYLALLAVERGIKALNSNWKKLPKVEKESAKPELSAPKELLTEEEKETSPYFDLARRLSPLSGEIYLLQAKAYFERAEQVQDHTLMHRALDLGRKAARCPKTEHTATLFVLEVLALLTRATQRRPLFKELGSQLEKFSSREMTASERARFHRARAHHDLEAARQSKEPLDLEKAASELQLAIFHGEDKSLHLELAQIWFDIYRLVDQEKALHRARGHLQIFSQIEASFEQLKQALTLQIEIYYRIGGALEPIDELFSLLEEHHLQQMPWSLTYAYALFVIDSAWDRRSSGRVRYFRRILKGALQEMYTYSNQSGRALLLKEGEKERPTRSLLAVKKKNLRGRKTRKSAIEPLQWMILQAELLCLEGVLLERVSSLKKAALLLNSYFDGHDDELGTTHTRFWLAKGRIELELGRYFEMEHEVFSSLQSLQRGLLLDTAGDRLWYLFAQAYYTYGEIKDEASSTQKSVTLFNQARSIGEASPYFWHDWACALLKLSEWESDAQSVEDAISCFERSLEMLKSWNVAPDPGMMYLYGSAWHYFGDLTGQEQPCEKAIGILKEVVALDPSNGDARYNLALAQMHYGQHFEDLSSLHAACTSFAFLARADHEDDYLWNEWGVSLIHYAQALSSSAEHEEAKERYMKQALVCLERAVALGCDHAHYNLGCAHALNGRVKEALASLEQAIKLRMHPSLKEIEEDEWLDALREEPGFAQLQRQIQESSLASEVGDEAAMEKEEFSQEDLQLLDEPSLSSASKRREQKESSLDPQGEEGSEELEIDFFDEGKEDDHDPFEDCF